MQSDEDSLTRLIEDVDKATASYFYGCGYFRSQREGDGCSKCPAEDCDSSCEKMMLDDIARRLHALIPHDMDGREIRPGDMIEAAVGTQVQVTHVMALPVHVNDGGADRFSVVMPYIWRVVEPDSWERLEQDAAKRVCEYAGAQKSVADADKYSCIDCPYDEPGPHTDKGCHERMRLDLVRRAKALAKAGEGE